MYKENNEELIKERLYAFFRDMKKWQTENEVAGKLLSKDISRYDEIYRVRRYELIQIFQEHCIYNEYPERDDMSYGNGYDESKEEVVEITFKTRNKAIVITSDITEEFQMYSKYFLTYNGSIWKIEDKKRKSYEISSGYFKTLL